ncbi:hypothetical protein HDE_00304 [Halotydeus destructor]|nr:hypothetical protein HDE_00304 [Halotydeus destructor]
MTQYARNAENGSDSKVSQMIDQWKASEDVTRDGLKAMYRKAFPVFKSDATLEDKMAYIDRIFEWFISSKEKYMIEHVVYTKKLVERIQELTSFPDTFPKEYLTKDYWLGQSKAMNQVVVRALVEFDKLFP